MNITSFFAGVIATLACLGIIYLLYRCCKHLLKSDDEFNNEETNESENYPDTINAFELIDDKLLGSDSETWVYTVYDTNTFVMYAIIVHHTYHGGGVTISPLYNADGTLRLYKKDSE